MSAQEAGTGRSQEAEPQGDGGRETKGTSRKSHCSVAMSTPQVPPLSGCPAPAAVGVDASCTISDVACSEAKELPRGQAPAARRKRNKSRAPGTAFSQTWEFFYPYYFIPTWINRLPAQDDPVTPPRPFSTTRSGVRFA